MSIEVWIDWGVTLVIVGGIARLDLIYRRRMRDRIDQIETRLDVSKGQAREALSAYKLEVAKSYTTTGYLKDVETRLTERLIRIEAKVDTSVSAQ
jgi:hypothetical protein